MPQLYVVLVCLQLLLWYQSMLLQVFFLATTEQQISSVIVFKDCWRLLQMTHLLLARHQPTLTLQLRCQHLPLRLPEKLQQKLQQQ